MSDLTQFLITTGRTLSQMALYSPEHPSVQGAIVESHGLLESILSQSPELSIGLNEGKIVVNGRVPEGVQESSLRPFIQLLTNFNLHSLSFLQGIRQQELIPFFRLTSRGEWKDKGFDVVAHLSSQGVDHIKFNVARYAKISEHETVGGKKAGVDKEGENLRKELESLPLNDLIRKLLERAVPNETDREKLFERALGLIKNQIDTAVNTVVKEFAKEKVRLTNERERTEGVVEKMADGIVVVDESGKVLMMNPAAESIYGVTLGECVGKPLWEGVREEQMVALAKDLALPADRAVTKEVNIHGAEEAKKTLRASTAAVQDTSGRIVGVVSVLSDVTKQKELTRMQNEFMANVTHDLRAPMHAVKLAVGAILEGAAGAVTTEQNKMLTLASRNVDRLARLIDDLLDFSKLESGAMQIHPQVVELGNILTEAGASMEGWAKSRGIALNYAPPANLPPVFADNDRVIQVVNNLVSNAIKFTPAGGKITLTAKSAQEEGKPMAVVSVADSGPGISKDDQKRIFERFVQLKNKEKPDIRGTGLGLSICRELVELHKGKLWIDSPVPGAAMGSQFSFSLPAVQRGSEIKKAAAPAPKPSVPKKVGFWKRLFSKLKIFLLISLVSAGLAQARPYWGTVRRVLDPVTIQLQDGTVVRFLGIDAPPKGSPRYEDAFAGTRFKLEKKEVRFDYGFTERTSDNIWLAYVYSDGVFINREMVEDGLALVSPLPNEQRILPELIQAERSARQAKRGLWADDGTEPFAERMQKKNRIPTADKKIPDVVPAPVESPLLSPLP